MAEGSTMSDALDLRERQLLHGWASGTVPPGFADRVLGGLDAELPDAEDSELESFFDETDRQRARARASWGRWLLAGAVTLAAAALVLVFVGALAPRIGSTADRAIAAAPPSRELLELRRLATEVFSRHCAPCHDGGQPGADDGALRVFDLRAEAWPSTMSDEQLDAARARLADREAVSPDERQDVDRFVQAELAHRHGAG